MFLNLSQRRDKLAEAPLRNEADLFLDVMPKTGAFQVRRWCILLILIPGPFRDDIASHCLPIAAPFSPNHPACAPVLGLPPSRAGEPRVSARAKKRRKKGKVSVDFFCIPNHRNHPFRQKNVPQRAWRTERTWDILSIVLSNLAVYYLNAAHTY